MLDNETRQALLLRQLMGNGNSNISGTISSNIGSSSSNAHQQQHQQHQRNPSSRMAQLELLQQQQQQQNEVILEQLLLGQQHAAQVAAPPQIAPLSLSAIPTTTSNLNSNTAEFRNPLLAQPQVPTSSNPTSLPIHIPAKKDDLSALPQLRERVRAHMEEAIKAIPYEDKEAYLEALETAPQVVKKESDSLCFIRRCDYDLWSAAKRLCLYWKERKRVFQDRAFLPLILTGQGALTEHDILTLHAGWPALLHDAHTASGERKKVVFFDRRKHIPSATVFQKLRCLFYIFKLLAEQGLEQHAESASSETAMFVALIAHTGRLYNMDWGWVQEAVSLANNIMPVKFEFVLLNKPNPNKPAKVKELMAKSTEYAIRLVGSVQVHSETQPGDLLRVCQEELGMSKAGIPECIGGEWRFQMAYEWCKERARVERNEYGTALNYADASPSMDPTSLSSAASALTVATQGGSDLSKKAPLPSAPHEESLDRNQKRKSSATATPKEDLEEEKRSKRRLADLIQSRRKRERQRREFTNLKQEAAQFQEDNVRLRAEHERLQRCLARAKQLVE